MDLAAYLHQTGKFDISFLCDYDEAFAERLPNYIHYHPVSMKRGISLGMFSAIRKMRKIFRREKFDIVQYSTPNAAFYASIAAKSAKIPVRLYCQWGIRYMGFEGITRFLFKILEKKSCKNSTHVEPESFQIFDFAVTESLYPRKKGEVIWNGSACGVNLERYNIKYKDAWRRKVRQKLNISESCIVFGFAARLTRDKGINELLAGFRGADLKDTHLVIMGSMDDESTIDPQLLAWAKTQNNITFTGQVSNIQEYYAALDVFISPSYREGFGLVLIEAQAMGLPVIATDVPGQIDAFLPNETGIPVSLKSSEGITKAMTLLAHDPTLRKHMGEAAFQYVTSSYSQDELFRRIADKRIHLVKGDVSQCQK